MINISDYSTSPPKDADRDKLEKETKAYSKRLAELHNLVLASKSHSVLVILQGMDASGKDGAVKEVFKYCTHNNFRTYSFKKPTEEEFGHDFLWRVHKQCPQKGELVVFNRSHYEDILIQRVHGWITEEHAMARMEAINSFEELLAFDNNTIIFKFFLHISYEQQQIELQQRLDEKEKHYKHNANDWEERKQWDKYMDCYEFALNESDIPWTVVPVDSRWYRNYIISKTMVERLESLGLEYPPLKEEK
ncbi:MAG: polyphosphate kinase [Saprospiraceae bacterium]|nr:polyphosphate kinase [Saprospiraceae bacterium]